MKRKLRSYLFLALMLMSQFPIVAHAAIGTITVDGQHLNVGQTSGEITLKLSSGVASADGKIVANDPSCVEIISVTSTLGGTTNSTFHSVDMVGDGLTSAGNIKIKGLKNCSTTLKITANIGSTDTKNEDRDLTFTSGTIVVGNSSTPDPTPSTKSSDATLKGITVTKGSLSPAFNKNTTSYTVEVDEEVTSIGITATPTDSKARAVGGGTKILSKGDNKYTITVTAEDGTIKEYVITVKRGSTSTEEPTPEEPKKSSNANLKSLDVSGYTLSPKFGKNTTSYSMTVNNAITGLNVTALAEDEKATVEVSGTDNWKVGVNNVKITVTAEDGSKKVYVVAVTRKDKDGKDTTVNKSSDNNLSSLIVKNGELSPKFAPNTTSYSVTIPNNADKLDLEYITSNSKAKVQVTGNGEFVVGETKTVSVIVTAEDGSQKIYTINVTKSDKESNNKLQELIIPGAELDPKFKPDVYEYTTEVKPGTKDLDVTAIAKNSKAKVEVIGNKNLKDGNNVILVKVTDEEGFVQYYKIDAYRKPNTFSIFGLNIPKWLGYLLLGLLVGLIFLLLFLLSRKRRRKQIVVQETQQAAPTIEFKPEFNFGSKNEDNDTVTGGVLSQGSGGINASEELPQAKETPKIAMVDESSIPYDPYDDIVTKDEIIDAIKEKDPEKLKILYEQEMLNRKKEKLKEKQEANVVDYVEKGSDYDEED